MSPAENQTAASQRMYTTRAIDYEDSWHPDHSSRFMNLIPIQRGIAPLIFVVELV
jgi:hypothetical protein